MKKTVLTFGLLAGAILSAMMAMTMPFIEAIGFDKGELIGYTSMLAAFLLIFFGVRSYRDHLPGGTVRFGQAFVAGVLMTAVAALCYVVTWELVRPRFAPDFMAKYQAHLLEQARADGDNEDEVAQLEAQMAQFAAWYENPFIRMAMTFVEPLPVGLIVSLVSAGILSRRRSPVGHGPAMSNRPAMM
jgi:Protein of unknown function (DUF4199)